MDLMTPTTTTYLSRLITAYLMKEQDEGNHIAFLGIVTDDDWNTSRVYDEVIPPLKVIALDFTNSARARIENAGGKCLSINQFPLTFKKTFLSGFAKYHDTTMVIFKPNKNNNKRSSSSSNQTTMRNVRRRIQGGREGDYYSYCIPTTTTPFMDNLNDDLLCEILIRLPAKTLGQLKVINKRWYSFISHPSFVTKHASLQTPRDASTFLFQTYERLVTLLSFDFPSPNLLSETTFTHSLPPDDYGTPTIVPQPKFFASGRGLLIVKTGYNTYIYNPLTKKYKYFPEPYESFYSHYGIIFGESTSSGHNHYTLVSLVEANKAFKFMVFLPNKSRWRDSNKSSMISYGTNGLQIYSICKDIFPVCYRGIMHWLTREGYIIAFNLDKEESRMIEIPKTVMSVAMRGEWWECTWLGVLEDEVILVVATSKHEIVTWVLHDYESNKWTIKRKDVINLKRVPVFYIRPLFFDGQRFLLTISTNIYYKSGHNAHLRLEHDVRTGVSKPLRSEGRTSFPDYYSYCIPTTTTPFMNNLNDDLLCEILIRLPAKTLGGLKVINKRWYSLISHPSFVTKHASLQTPQDASTFLFQTYRRLATLLSFDCPSRNLFSETTFILSLPHHIYGTPILVSEPHFLASGRGLLIVRNGYNICIYNPLTKKNKCIPEPYKMLHCDYGVIFGGSTSSDQYDYNNHYTLVCLVEALKSYKFMIFMPKKRRWRDSNKSSMISYGANRLKIYSICQDIFHVCYRGIIHWLTEEGYIIAFNLDKEESRMIEIPKSVMAVEVDRDWRDCTWLGVLEDEVILVVATSKHEIVTWVLDDYENNKWKVKRKDVINPERIPIVYIRPLFFDGQRFLLTISTNIEYKFGCKVHLRMEHDVRTGVSKPLLSEGGKRYVGSLVCVPIINTLTEV